MTEAVQSDAGAGAGGPPPEMPETFSGIAEAARFLAAKREREEAEPAAKPAKQSATEPEGADNGDAEAVETELSDEDNAAPGEDQAHGGDEDADPEAERQPPLARPKSWGKEDQAEWDSLSRSQQEKIAAREEAREKAIRKAQNEAAENAKAHKAKVEEADKARADYEGKARTALDILAREQQRDFADIKTAQDVANLSVSDPLRYLQWDAHQKQLAAIKDAVDAADKSKAEKAESEWKKFRADENAKAIELIPELGDKAKAPKFMEKAVALLQDVGFTPAELGKFDKGEKLSFFDARVQRMIADAIRYRDIQAAKTAVTARPVPPVARPGVRQPTGSAASERINNLTKQFNTTGNLKDAAKLLAARRSGSRR